MLAGTLTSVAGTQPELGADISNLEVTVTDISPSILRVTIGAAGRWTVPQGDIFQNVDVASAPLCLSVVAPHTARMLPALSGALQQNVCIGASGS